MNYEDYRNIIRKHSSGVVEFTKKDGSNRRLIFNNALGKMYLNGGTYSGKNYDWLEPVFEVAADGSPIGWKTITLKTIISLKV